MLLKLVNIFFRTLVFYLLLLVSIAALGYYTLQLPKFQTIAVSKLTVMLSDILKTKVEIGSVDIKWTDAMTLKNVVIEDANHRKMIVLDELDIDYNTIDLDYPNFKVINLDYLMLKKPNVKVFVEKNGSLNIQNFIDNINTLTAPAIPGKPNQNSPFTIDQAYIQDGIFTFTDPAAPKFNDGTFEFYHFTLENINANLNNFLLLGDTIKFEGKGLRAIDKHSKLEIKRLDTDFLYCFERMQLNKLYAEIGKSIVKDRILFTYANPSYLNDFNNKVKIDANFKETKLHTSDLAKFAPVLKAYDDDYYLNAKFVGTVKDFSMKDANIRFGKNSHFVGDLAFKNLPDVLKADMDLNLKTAILDTEDTRQYVGDSAYFSSVKKFGTLSFNGTFKGFYNNFKADGDFKSGLGNVLGDLQMKWDKDFQAAEYNGNVTTQNLDIGKLIGDEKSIQKVSITTKIAGKGFGLQTATVRMNGKLPSIGINGYNYKNVDVNGTLAESLFNGRLSVRDSNLTFDLNGKVDLKKDKNAFDLVGKIDRANLKSLGFTKSDLILHTDLDLNLKGNTVDDIFGEAKFLNSTLGFDGKILPIDTLYSTSTFDNGLRKINIISEFFNASFVGKFTPSRAIEDIQKLAAEYELYFLGTEAQRNEYYKTQTISIGQRYGVDYQVTIKQMKPLFKFFVPDLYISPQTELTGSFKVANNVQFSLFGEADTLSYGSAKFFQNELDLNSFQQKIADSSGLVKPKILTSLIFNSKKQALSEAAPTENMEVSGEWGQGNTIEFYSRIKQQNSTNRAKLFGGLTFLSDGIDIKLKSDTLKTFVYLLNEKWNIDPQNLITISNNELCFSNLRLSDGNQALALNGVITEDPDKIAGISVEDFDLETVKPFVKDFDFVGKVNGRIVLRDLFKSPVLTTDTLTIDEILYKNKYIGSLSANAIWNQEKQRLEVNSQVVFQSNTIPIVSINGTYDPNNKTNALNLRTVLRDTDLGISEPFLKDVFHDFGGKATGAIAITGVLNDPIFEGFINFSKGKLIVNSINTPLFFDNEKLYFDGKEQALKFKNFKVKDDLGNIGILSNGIYYGGGGKFLIDLKAKMNKYKIMSTTAQDISSFYGTAFATGNLEISGPPENLEIKAKLTSNKGTILTVPLDGATSIAKENPFVVFVDTRKKVAKVESKKEISLSNMSLDFSFNFTPDATCEIVVDSKTNEKIFTRGNSTDFRVFYDTRGQFSMNGQYVITDGTYDFKFQGIANKAFTIDKGSVISWNGSPYDGTIDVKTIYTQMVSINSISSAQTTTKYPVNVSISLKNKLLKPDIRYGLKFKEYPIQNREDVLAFESSLQNDDQELTNNVGSVLVLGQLFPKDAGSQFATRAIVGNFGEILSGKLGNLASKLSNKLELGVSLQSLGADVLNNMNLRFAYKVNDRLRFSGNGSYNDNSTQQTINTNRNLYYSGELEYLLSPEGNVRLKVYSKNMPPNLTGGQSNFFLNGVILQYSKSFNYIIKKKLVVNSQENKTENIVQN